ncbi:MAG: class I SAM-dependent methyltransferase [Candidatus Acidiferrales bacterium]
MTATVRNVLRDPFKQLLFELGAGYYARKIASGPEADIRREFVDSLQLPPSGNGHGTLRVLDVGCGPGHVARELAQSGHEVTGVDRSRSLLRIAKKLARRESSAVQFQLSNTDKLPFVDASFDCCYATGVIYWVENIAETLREMVRVTRSAGTVAALDPHASMSVSRVLAHARENRMNARDTRKLLAWATVAQCNRRFEEGHLRRLLTDAGLESLTLEQRLGGMVWFWRGTVPARASWTARARV